SRIIGRNQTEMSLLPGHKILRQASVNSLSTHHRPKPVRRRSNSSPISRHPKRRNDKRNSGSKMRSRNHRNSGEACDIIRVYKKENRRAYESSCCECAPRCRRVYWAKRTPQMSRGVLLRGGATSRGDNNSKGAG